MDACSRRIQYLLNATVGNVVYGPLKARWDEACSAITGRPNWARNRYPAREKLKTWGALMEDWPLAASCSPFASWMIAGYLGLGEQFKPRWGRSVYKMLHDPVVAPHVRWLRGGRRRYHWWHLPTEIPWPLFSWRTRGHTGLGINGDLAHVYHPQGWTRLEGIWVWVADGRFDDTTTRVRKWTREHRPYWGPRFVRRVYSGQSLVLETALMREVRIRRRLAGYRWPSSRKRAERRGLLGIAGLVMPEGLDPDDYRSIMPFDGRGDRLEVPAL